MKKTLKKLADEYFFENANITQQEYNALSTSKYAKIFDFKPFQPGVVNEKYSPKPRQNMRINVGVQRIIMRELVDYVEAALGINLGKSLYNRYANVDINKVKQLIAAFERDTPMNEPTKAHLKAMLESSSIERLFYTLYSH